MKPGVAPARVPLAMRPTPVARLDRVKRPDGVELWMKRDDLTGSVLSGNKVRKLEYLLADARERGADIVLTCGGAQSNHCRATAIAARQLGMGAMLFLRVDDPSAPPPPTGNLLLDHIVGADVRFVSRAEYTRRVEVMEAAAVGLRASGRTPYSIPEGGSNALGSLGYYDCVGELVEQLGGEPLTIVYAAGSGGTGAGLVAGVLERKLPWRVVGVNVCDDRAYFVRAIGSIVDAMKRDFGLDFAFDREALEIVEGFVGLGYARSRKVELDAIVALARCEGVVLDPVYTGKAWFGLVQSLGADPQRFGKRIVFLHTGGVYGIFGGVFDDPVLRASLA